MCYIQNMSVKHFTKTLFLFIGMIAVGLVIVFLTNYFDNEGQQATVVGDSSAEIQK